MSSTVVQPVPTRSSRNAGRVAAITVGVILAAFGSVLALSGGAVFAVFGSDGQLTSGRESVDTPTAALVSETATIEETAAVTDVLGSPRIKISADAAADKDVFVGVAASADVDRYLAGAAVEEVTDVDVDPFDLNRDRKSGRATLAP